MEEEDRGYDYSDVGDEVSPILYLPHVGSTESHILLPGHLLTASILQARVHDSIVVEGERRGV